MGHEFWERLHNDVTPAVWRVNDAEAGARLFFPNPLDRAVHCSVTLTMYLHPDGYVTPELRIVGERPREEALREFEQLALRAAWPAALGWCHDTRWRLSATHDLPAVRESSCVPPARARGAKATRDHYDNRVVRTASRIAAWFGIDGAPLDQ